MIVVYILLILILISSIASLIYVINYNKLKMYEAKINQAESIIDEELRKKYDYLMKVDVLFRDYLKKDKTLMNDLKKIKDTNFSSFELDRKIEESMLVVYKITGDNPDINNFSNYTELITEIKNADEKLSAAKNFYNKYTAKFNEVCAVFPANIIAKVHHLSIKKFYDGKDLQDDITNDFKL